MTDPAALPPTGLAGLDPAWSRLIQATDADGAVRGWHALDTGAPSTGTIVCVHGNPTWSYAFRRVLADPPPGWRVVAVDHLDMGFSERTGTERRLARRIEDLEVVLDALEVEGPVLLVAHDWGGPIALGWALEHLDRVVGVVLTNTAVHQPPDAAAPTLIRAARTPGVLDTLTVDSTGFLRGALALSRPPLPASVRAGYLAPYTDAARRAAIGGFVRDIPLEPDHPSAETLAAVAEGLDRLADVPVLLLWGAEDPVFSDRYLHDLETRLPHADVHRVDGAGHLTPEDTELAGALRTWVAARVGAQVSAQVDAQVSADVDAQFSSVGTDPADVAAASPTSPAASPTSPEAASLVPPAASPTSPEAASPTPARRPLWAALGDPGIAATDAIVEPPVSDDLAPRRVTFGTLDHDVHALAIGLHRHGVRAGDRVACMITPGRELATLLAACWRLGAIVVLADAGLGARGLGRALRSAAPDHLVGISRALVAGGAMRWPGRRIAASDVPEALRRASGATATVPQLLAEGAAALADAAELRRTGDDGASAAAAGADPVGAPAGSDPAGAGDAGDTPGNADMATVAVGLLPRPPATNDDAAIAFTSGSTGAAKGVLYRHHQLEAQRDALVRAYDITGDDRLVAAFAPFALYGPLMGITSMVPDMDVTAPSTLTATAMADAVAAVGATLVFASPAALVNVAATAGDLQPRHRAALGGVRLLLSAGAPVPAELLRRLTTVLPNAAAHTPYGMTEVLPVADIDLDTIDAVGAGPGVCVGHPVPGVEVAISPLDDTAAATGALTLQPDVTGEVCIRAGHVKQRYDRRAITELASGRDPGWHRSGDVGHLDTDGRLWIEGRLAHVLTTAGGVVTPVGIERRVEGIDHVTMAAAVGVGPPGTQQVVVVVATDPAPGRPQLAPRSLTDRVRAVVAVDVAAVIAVPRLPVDIRHESKIDRAEVARAAERLLAGRGLRRRSAAEHTDTSDGRPRLAAAAEAGPSSAAAEAGPSSAEAEVRGLAGAAEAGPSSAEAAPSSADADAAGARP